MTHLPGDIFTTCIIDWKRTDNPNKTFTVSLKLPSQCSIKSEITSDPQVNVNLAKQHSAFKACVMLYENGELNDRLLPIDAQQNLEQHNDEYFLHWNNYGADKENAGTKGNRRPHRLKTADVLQNCAPKLNEISFLYRIIIRPMFEASSSTDQMFHKFLGNGNEFGILTSKRIPKLCKIPLFPSYGEIEVELSALPQSVTLTTLKELKLLQAFHVGLFRDVLSVWEEFFVLDETSFLIVPLETSSIDWKIAGINFKAVNSIVSSSSVVNRVVSRNYLSSDQNEQKHAVVGESLNADSRFPGSGVSYKEYYRAKHGKTILNSHQPLIEVKGISKEMNLFFPGVGATGQQLRVTKKEKEYFVPEFCDVYDLPADYWIKAMFLPAICHRIHHLLLTESLRNWIVVERIDDGCGQQDYKLDVDVKHYSDTARASVSRNASSYNTINISTTPKVLDIDRDMFSATASNINQLFSFITSSHEQAASSQTQQNSRTLVHQLKEIKIIRVHEQNNVVQQKHLIKALTTINSGKISYLVISRYPIFYLMSNYLM